MATKTENQKARFDTRLPKEQKQLFERAAAIGGYRNLTDFVILSVQEKAMKIIQERESIISSQRDCTIFFDALMEPPTPNQNLVLASLEYKKALGK